MVMRVPGVGDGPRQQPVFFVSHDGKSLTVGLDQLKVLARQIDRAITAAEERRA